MNNYIKIANFITPQRKNNVSLDIFTSTGSFMELMDGLTKGEKYAILKINEEVMMSETPMEHRTNIDFIHHAYGDVLIGGLGIGMIIMAIQDDPKVTSITVIEQNQDVIDIISSQIPFNNKVKIIQADVFKWKPNMRYDCIYMDIWAYVNRDVYEEMVKLKRKYGHYLKPLSESPNRFNKCWAEYQARNNLRL